MYSKDEMKFYRSFYLFLMDYFYRFDAETINVLTMLKLINSVNKKIFDARLQAARLMTKQKHNPFSTKI